MSRALVTGAAGQDGHYLTTLLLSKGYEVFGVVGPEPGAFAERAAGYGDAFTALDADLSDMDSLLHAVDAARPSEVYNLAGRSFVGDSWRDALASTDINAVGALRLLEAMRQVCPEARFFQAASAEVFGGSDGTPQTEDTPIRPRSPYAAAKAYALHIVHSYRESYDMHASCGILFNHESPLREPQYVTRKITTAVARIRLGLDGELTLGNLDARRDWGFAGDYVEAMWLMLQQPLPDDYVVATGETHSVREFCEAAFSRVDLDYRDFVRVDESLFRPVDVPMHYGDATRARERLGWYPRATFEDIVAMMVDADIDRLGGVVR